jgi:sugar/nucleoside kinase (ribokinase family)
MRICALGDLTLDILVRLEAPLAVGGDTLAEITLSAGGQAANVAAWAAALGAQARFIGKQGADEAGRLAAASLRERGVEVCCPVEGRSALVCSLVAPDGERSMASDRGSAAALTPDEVDPSWLARCERLFVSGYALLRSPAREAARRAASIARAEGATIAVDLASWSAIRDTGSAAFRAAVSELQPDVVFASEEEDRWFGGPLPGASWILKRGARGCSFAGEERPALPVEQVVDTTGAGDALAAGWLVGGPDLALEAAARCVAKLGAQP